MTRRCWATVLSVIAVIGIPSARSSCADELGERTNAALRAAVDRVAPSVVRIETLAGAGTVETPVEVGPTTGVIVSSDGHIVTSGVRFAGRPTSILVTLADGRRLAAKQLAADLTRNLVLLKVDVPAGLPTPEVAPLKEIRVGGSVVAVGRTYDERRPNVAAGIISAIGRVWGKAIQTDAKTSAANYGGPLVDVRGRVVGIITPIPLDDVSPLGDLELYDSGIGFAVPLEHVLAVLPRWKEGTELRPGIAGVTFAGGNLLVDPPLLASVRVQSPAAKAGLRAGDKLLEVNGRGVETIAHLRQQIGPLYAGDRVRVVAARGTERIAAELELVAELPPYEHPFLGVLPLRDGDGVTVRYVYPHSPAADVGIHPGDKLAALDGKPVANPAAAVERLAAFQRGDRLKLSVVRGQQTLTPEVTLGTLPTMIPDQLPAPHKSAAVEKVGQRPAIGIVPVRLPQFKNQAFAYVPEDYDPRRSYGLLIWPNSTPLVETDAALAAWKKLAAERGVILLVAKSAERGKWQPGEVDFVIGAAESLLDDYRIDSSRVVSYGREGDGTLAYLAAFRRRSLVRGVATIDAPLPPIVDVPTTDPVARLAILAARSKQPRASRRVEQAATKLLAAKHPVTTMDVGVSPRDLNADELAAVFRWLDTLDRL